MRNGSSMPASLLGGGMSAGLSTSTTSPVVRWARYSTDGTVAMRLRLNSRSSRSRTISMCSRPRKPHRNPKPSTPDVSGSYVNDESLSRSFSRASRKSE